MPPPTVPPPTVPGASAPTGPSVLLAEHDAAVADMLARYLSRDGLWVRRAAIPDLALAGLADGADAVAVLDLTMPGLDPRRVRQALGSPVVFLVAPGPRPRGLNRKSADARRWLTRPFAPRQLVATVRQLLDGPGPSAGPAHGPPAGGLSGAGALSGVGGLSGAGGLVLNGGRRLAVVEGRDVPLTGKEFAILATLLGAHGRPCTRSQLLAATGSRAGERSVDVHIAELRAKLGVPGLIRTVRGVGFAITAPALPLPPFTAVTDVTEQREGSPLRPRCH
jgi:DNA-binding response OmpR family regulator